jgi:hypothetical protein
MALSVMQIASVSPRGGAAGAVVTVTGVGFGVVLGSVVFDPLGVNIAAVVSYWDDSTIIFAVPVGVPQNHNAVLVVTKAGGADTANIFFWIPAALPLADGLDYAYPSAEQAAPDADDPAKFEARDFNRVLDRLKAAGGAVVRAKVADYTILPEERAAFFFTNAGALAEVTFFLPTPALGPPTMEYRFGVVVGQYLRVKAPVGVTINLGGVSCAPGGFMRSNVVGATCRLILVSATQFMAEGFSGTWSDS